MTTSDDQKPLKPAQIDQSTPEPERREPEPARLATFGHPALDAIAIAVGGRQVVVGVGVALLLAAAAAAVGLLGGDRVVPGHSAPSTTVESVGSMFSPVPPAELDKAIALLMLSDADRAKIRGDVQSGRMRIALITVLDNDAEDGDWVSITGAGFRQDVRLFHKPYTVAVPYLPGTTVAVTGLKDGGGGDITVTVLVGAGRLPLKSVKERETIHLTPP